MNLVKYTLILRKKHLELLLSLITERKKRNTKIQKPWFDLDCKFERQYYRKMKHKHTFRNSNNSRKERKEDEKKYKMQMDTSIRKYRKK